MVPDSLVTPFFVVIMALGFGGLVFFHEMGHFLAAKWAKVRVYAFAIGFGRPIVSYRKGFGFRSGSSEQEYLRLRGSKDAAVTSDGERVSHTEYRLNMLPFGGYVKMMGQDDLDPSQRPDHPASFMSAKKWKRAVILLGGVIANVLLAMVLFVIVYVVGIKEAAPVVGGVVPNSPAERAGIEDGARIVSVGGVEATSFTDVIIGPALHSPGKPIDIVYVTPNGEERTASLVPEDLQAGFPYREIGLRAATSATLPAMPIRAGDQAQRKQLLQAAGLDGIDPGATVTAVNGVPVETVELQDGSLGVRFRSVQRAISDAYDAAPEEPIELTLRGEGDGLVTRVAPVPRAPLGADPVAVPAAAGSAAVGYWPVEHLVGLTPLMAVGANVPPRQGLEVGDTFLSIGDEFYPDPASVIRTLRENAGRSLEITVLRRADTFVRAIQLTVQVDQSGRVGFNPVTSHEPIIAQTPEFVELDPSGGPATRAALTAFERVDVALPLPGGVRIDSIDGSPTRTIDGAFRAVRSSTAAALEAGEGATIALALSLLQKDGVTVDMPLTLEVTLTADEVIALHEGVWRSRELLAAFGPLEGTVQASGPIDALGVGARRTWRTLQQTYLTLKRILQNTVPADQIQGPVGITHTGSMIAEQGVLYLLLILALISANLAVVNMIPIPITDGGQLVMLLYETIRGKPLPIAVQSLITFAGLMLVISIFLFVTFNDISRIVGGP